MSFEARVTRQNLPAVTTWGNDFPIDGSTMLKLTPPDTSGSWRYREMHLIPAIQPFDFATKTLAGPQPLPFEAYVVWEKYKEDEKA